MIRSRVTELSAGISRRMTGFVLHGPRSGKCSSRRPRDCNVVVERRPTPCKQMSVRLALVEQMAQVAQEHGKILAPLRDDLVLADSGLNSLGLAVVIARLEDTLSVKFMAAKLNFLPVTFGDLVKMFENATR